MFVSAPEGVSSLIDGVAGIVAVTFNFLRALVYPQRGGREVFYSI